MLGLSALTWFVIIVAGYALLLLILPREYMWIPFVAVVVAMTVLAYHIVPDETEICIAITVCWILCESRERPVWTISSI